jgi:translation initiation factor eIF-2B subunit gamma
VVRESRLRLYLFFLPLLGYSLTISAILVLTLSEHHAAIQSYVRSLRMQKTTHHVPDETTTHQQTTSLYVQVEAASAFDDNLGTADVIRVAYNKGWLNSDFAVVPCDLVTNLEGSRLAELWMVAQASFDADLGRRSRKYRTAGDGEDGRRGGLIVCYDTLGEGAVKGQETDFLAASPIAQPTSLGAALPSGGLGILLTTAPTQALKDLNQLPIRHSMVKKYPDFKLYSTFRDAGICFFPHWVLKFIDRNPWLNSIREDVLPWLSKSRWQNPRLAQKLGLHDILTGSNGEDVDSEETALQEYDVGSMSTTRVRRSSILQETVEIPPVIAYFPNSPSMFMRRVDTVHLYLYTALHLAKSDPSAPAPVKIDPSATIAPKAIITAQDCLVGEKSAIGERAVIKKSILGANVTVARGARLIGCLLMDGVEVGENAKLEGCTVGRKAVIGAKASLKDCEVAEGFYVENGGELCPPPR